MTNNPTPKLPAAVVRAQAEIAQRVLARRRLIPFVQRFNPKYKAGWVHEDICRRLERFSREVAEGKNPRLMILMPPRHGKSELASRNFPAWHMGQYPDHEFISCSYNLSLAMDFSRKVKQIISDPLYGTVFDTKLDPNNQSTESWGVLDSPGGYVAAGIGGPITGKGAHCLHPQTLVTTVEGLFTIEHLYLLEYLPEVITPLGPRRVLAATKRPAPQMYTLRFASGAVLRATSEHPVYLPDESKYVTVGELHGKAEGNGGLGLRVLREVVSEAEVQSREVCAPGVKGVLLRQGVQPSTPRGEERQVVSDLRSAGYPDPEEPKCEVLFGALRTVAGAFSAEGMPGMCRGVSAETFKAGVLRGDLRRYGAHDTHAWGDELQLPDGHRIRVLVRPDEAADLGQGQSVCGLPDGEESALPPHQREPERQLPLELGDVVQPPPHDAPQVCYDTLYMVERDGVGTDYVYDLQVAESGCFFAAQILVGNCLIIDDPVKNAEEADSSDVREKIWQWYLSTAYSRLAPGGGVLIIQTWWHDDDLAGRLQTMMKEGSNDEHVDQFEVVKYSAIAEADEYLNHTTDLIEYDAPPEDPHTLLRCKGEALHPERYDLDKLLRIKAQNKGGRWWSALYQQNPVPDDGGYFTKDQFRQSQAPQIKDAYVYIAWDFAISEKKQNDYTVGTVGLQDNNDVLHVVDQLRFKSGDAFFIVESILNLSMKWYSPTLILGFEDGQIYRAIEALLKKRMRERKFYPSIVVLRPVTDKMARARPLQGRMQQGMVSFSAGAPWYESMKTELLRFPAGVHDDQVDSLAWMAQLVIGREAPRKTEVKPMKSWKDKLKTLGSSQSHMVA